MHGDSLSFLANQIFVGHKLSCHIDEGRCGINEYGKQGTLQTFQIESSKHLQQEALEKMVHI